MPSVNIYTLDKTRAQSIESILPGLREFTAKALSCAERMLASDEISLRIIILEYSLPIADTELEIIAHQYPERIANQDSICTSIKSYVQEQCPGAGSVYVWLQLSELGASLRGLSSI